MEVTDMMYDLAEQLKSLRDEKKEAEQRVKDINAALDDVEYRWKLRGMCMWSLGQEDLRLWEWLPKQV